MYGLGAEGLVIKATVASGVVTADVAIGTTVGAAGVDVVSRAVDFSQFDLLSVHALATGDADGAWDIEWSNNFSPGASEGRAQRTNAGDWAAESPRLIAAPGGDGQNDNIEIQFRAFRGVRFRFTPSGGSGTVQLWIFCKGR